MQVFYVIGNTGVGKTTLTSIIAYNLFLRNYQVGILDLTDRGKGYFFRFGACDFFALGEGSINIPNKLLVNLQDMAKYGNDTQDFLHTLPLMPGLKICISAPDSRDNKFTIAKSFIEKFQEYFDILFIEMEPPLQLLKTQITESLVRVMVICSDAQEDWPGKDNQLLLKHSRTPRKVKVILNKQKEELIAATKFIETNMIGVDYILPGDKDLLANTSVMEMCKHMATNRFLKKLIPLVNKILIV